MSNKKLYTFLISMIILAVAASACKPAAAPESEAVKVLFLTEDPIGVNPYFISGQEGLEKAAEDFGVETKIVECTGDPTNMDENLRATVREDWDLYILISFGFEDTLKEVAPENPDTTFVCIDCAVDLPNVLNVGFKSHEAAYLLGIAAGMLTETDIIGSVGPVEMPFMTRWTIPFGDAAKSVNPDVEVLETLWVGDWADPATAKELALTMADKGADYINGAAAAGNPGIFEAAEERDFITTGVDINECPKAPGYILENTIKRMDIAVYSSVKAFLDGELEGGFYDHGLADGGVDLAVFSWPDVDSECVLAEHPDVLEKVEEVRQDIIDGTLVIPDPLFAE